MKATPRELLAKFYLENNLPPDGGQSLSSVKIEITKKIHFYIPNFEARKKAVLKHDIHHMVTGYSASSLIGESEISALEIAAGCKNYWAAFFINVSGVIIGLPLNFYRVLKAFARGRRSISLYHDIYSDNEAMDLSIESIQNRLTLPMEDIKLNFTDVFLFIFFVGFGFVYSILITILMPFILGYSVYSFYNNRNENS